MCQINSDEFAYVDKAAIGENLYYFSFVTVVCSKQQMFVL
jgi:hypothetical protein